MVTGQVGMKLMYDKEINYYLVKMLQKKIIFRKISFFLTAYDEGLKSEIFKMLVNFEEEKCLSKSLMSSGMQFSPMLAHLVPSQSGANVFTKVPDNKVNDNKVNDNKVTPKRMTTK